MTVLIWARTRLALFALGLFVAAGSARPGLAEQTSNEQIQARHTENSEILEEVVVTGRAHRFYRVSESSLGTKTPTDFLDIPNSIQVLSNQLIEDLAARQITDLYRSISGISQYTYSGVTARGFRQDEVRYDGVAGDPFSQFGIPELFNIERVEVLKGPAGMLYGASQPGGLINYVTKKPTSDPEGKITVRGGNYNLYGLSGEFSGPLNEAGTVLGRIGGFHQRNEPFRYNFKDENTIVDLGLTFAPGDDTSLLLQATYVEQRLAGGRARGVPVDDDGNFLADIRWTASEPTDYQYLESNVLQGVLKHKFDVGDGLQTSLALRHIDNERVQKYHEPRGVVDLDGDGIPESMRRQFRDQFRTNDEFSITLDNVYVAQLFGRQHTFLAGIDYFSQDAVEDQKTAPSNIIGFEVPSLSLSNPVYGLTSGTNYTQFPVATFIDGALDRSGIYFQDQVKVTERWQVVAGLRFDSYQNDDLVSALSFSDNELTWRGGLIYRLRPDVSMYSSYSEGFLPQSLGNQDTSIGGPFDPEESRQVEVGIKSELFDGRVQGSIAVYQIVKENVLQPDPDPGAPVGSLIEFGEVTSEGAELDVVADVTENWVLMANYAYNDTRITSTTGDYIADSAGDNRFSNAPEHQAGLWTRLDFPPISSAVAGGFDFIDERLSFSSQRVPSYTTFDLSWHTYWENLHIQMNIKNLFDKEFAQSGFTSRAGHFPGEPRTFIVQVSAAL